MRIVGVYEQRFAIGVDDGLWGELDEPQREMMLAALVKSGLGTEFGAPRVWLNRREDISLDDISARELEVRSGGALLTAVRFAEHVIHAQRGDWDPLNEALFCFTCFGWKVPPHLDENEIARYLNMYTDFSVGFEVCSGACSAFTEVHHADAG